MWIVLLPVAKLDWRLAFRPSVRWYGVLSTFLIFLLGVLVACGGRGGEHVTYAIWNRSSQEIDDARLFIMNGRGEQNWLAVNPRMYPLPPGAAGWQSGGSAFLPDVNHRVPEKMNVSLFRDGRPEGPVVVDLRAKIPAEVLEKIRGNVRYELQIGIGAGINPPAVRWVLYETVPDKLGPQELQRGGDW